MCRCPAWQPTRWVLGGWGISPSTWRRGIVLVCVLVDDDAIVAARSALWTEYRMPAEYGAATAYAGAELARACVAEPGERVAVVVCGANADPRTL